MAWLTHTTELRTLVSDGATDKLRYRKKILGRVDTTNLVFKTLEKRRLTNFKTETNARLGVFINGVRLSEVTGIASDDPDIGEVTLVAAPANGVYVEATYYVQWFLDTELGTFLLEAAEWLGFTAATEVPPGLRPAAKYFAAQEGYHKLALRWAETLSEEFRLEDAPEAGSQTPVEMYRKLAEDARKKSEKLRDDYYSGQGQQNQAQSVSLLGRVPKEVPQA